MKVMILAPHIFSDINKVFFKRNSGFGRVLESISIGLSKSIDVEILTYIPIKAQKYKGVNFCKVSIIDVICSLKVVNIRENLQLLRKLKQTKLKDKIILFIKLSYENYFYKKIILNKPDILHIHGLTIETVSFIKAAVRSKIPFLLTIHGMNYSNIEAIKKIEKVKEFEIEMMKILNNFGVPITVLTQKTKDKIIEDFFRKSINMKIENIKIIPNGIDKNYNKIQKSLKNIEGYLENNKNKVKILSVGSLVERKNQILLLKSLCYLSIENLEKIRIIICGDGPMRKELEDFTRMNNLQKYVVFFGNVDNDSLKKIYQEGNFLSMTSLTEGFGLPVLEALKFNNYILSIEDLEFVSQIKEMPFCLTVNNRDPKAYANLIDKALKIKKFEIKTIEKFIEKYHWESIIQKYIDIYEDEKNEIFLSKTKINQTLNKIYGENYGI